MNGAPRSFLLLASLATIAGLAVAQPAPMPAPAPAPVAPVRLYPGVVSTPGGGICTENFLYDGGNLAGGVFISQGCAINAGLGAGGGPNGFVPPAGTPCMSLNNGAYQVWVFPCCTVLVNDVRGTPCFCKSTIYVSKTPGQAINKGIISRAWGQCVGACDDAVSGAYWPSWPTAVAALVSHATVTDSANFEIFDVTVRNGGTSHPVEMGYIGSSGYSFLPASAAQALELPLTEIVDLSVADPATLTLLEINGLRPAGQTRFPLAYLPELDLGSGTRRAGWVLVIDDADSPCFILGGRDAALASSVAHVPGQAPEGHDWLYVDVPAPAVPSEIAYGVTPVAAAPDGSIQIHPVLPAESFVEGWTLVSFLTNAGPYGHGPALGLYPDTVTWAIITSTPTSGDVFHFTGHAAGLYPSIPARFPPGTLPLNLPLDVGMAFRTASGQIRFTSTTRIVAH